MTLALINHVHYHYHYGSEETLQLLRLIIEKQTNFERMITTMGDAVEERLIALDRKQDEQTARLLHLFEGQTSLIEQLKLEVKTLTDNERKRFGPLIDALEENVSAMAQIGTEGTQSAPTGEQPPAQTEEKIFDSAPEETSAESASDGTEETSETLAGESPSGSGS